ncbi:HypC/HybG/HupF family hydrogenase formation chaperone [Propionibacterium sp.]|uniref:HypC/HybG/HupF family hydrogenase formation chaperone n=1 Tax=Propionibacterium sp. TaxID=1977903 RepID=UPI0039EBA750
MCLGVPAEVIAIPDAAVPRARVAISGVQRTVATDLLADEDIEPGDWVLVHVGFALSRIDADEAAITLDQIKRLGSGTFETELDAFRTSAIG